MMTWSDTLLGIGCCAMLPAGQTSHWGKCFHMAVTVSSFGMFLSFRAIACVSNTVSLDVHRAVLQVIPTTDAASAPGGAADGWVSVVLVLMLMC